MTIQLFNSTAELNVLNKSSYLTLVATLTGTLREGCNVTDPSITIEFNSLPNFNYVYIPELNRYYFVKDIDNVRNKLWTIRLHIDVLMTYKTQILQLEVEVDRNEYDYDLLLVDNNRVNEITYDLDITQFSGGDDLYYLPDVEVLYDTCRNVVLYSVN